MEAPTPVGPYGRVVCCAMSPTGDVLAIADENARIRVESIEGDLFTTLDLETPAVGLGFVDKGRGVVAVTASGSIIDFGPDGSRRREFTIGDSPWSSAAFSPDGRTMVTAGENGAALWKLGPYDARLLAHIGTPASACALSGGIAAIGLLDGRFGWMGRDGGLAFARRRLPGPVVALVAGSDKTRLAAASSDGTVALLDDRTGVTTVLRGEGAHAGTTSLTADWRKRVIAVGAEDGTIRMLRIGSSRTLDVTSTTDEPVDFLLARRRRGELVAVHPKGTAEVRSLATGERIPARPFGETPQRDDWAPLVGLVLDRSFAARSPRPRIADEYDLEELLGCAPEMPPLEELLAKGVKPEDVPRIAAVVEAEDRLEAEIDRQSKVRVLNACLASTEDRRLKATEPLVSGRPYDLLLQIGPRWPHALSLVAGEATVCDSVFDADEEGHLVQAVLIGEQLTASPVDGWMWLPRAFGESRPVVEGTVLEDPAPIRLRFIPPDLGASHDGRARGRLNLYYRNNLLQSAAVDLALATGSATRGAEPHRILVDFALTGDFAELESRFEHRRVALGKEDCERQHPVRLSVTMNSDANGGGQRFILKSDPDLPPAVIAYNPVNADVTLRRARRALLDCFTVSNDAGEPVPDSVGLGPNGGKTKQQFRYDLRRLAAVGVELRSMAVGALSPEAVDAAPALPQSDWRLRLAAALKKPGVIQIARTAPVPDSFVFPWALVYEYPAFARDPSAWLECKVLDEWGEDGVRHGDATGACPYEDEEWHEHDVLCPYGFWGLKHIIELPLSPLPSRRETGGAARSLESERFVMALGTTTDPDVLPLVAGHVAELRRRLPESVMLPADGPADCWNDVVRVVGGDPTPTMLYLLCHGCWDEKDGVPFLNIGPPEGPDVRLYASQVDQWVELRVSEAWLRGDDHRGLVFLNGCHTAALAAGQMLNFATAFKNAGAGAIIGTEVSVLIETAADIGASLVERLGRYPDGIPVGQAMREMRWEMAGKGNLLGFAYTPYGIADFGVRQRGAS